jgi:hypothetical protein
MKCLPQQGSYVEGLMALDMLVALLRSDWVMRTLTSSAWSVHWWIHNLMALLGDGGNSEMGPRWRKWLTGSVSLKDAFPPWLLPWFSLLPAAMRWAVLPHHTLCTVIAVSPQPKINMAKEPWTETSETLS